MQQEQLILILACINKNKFRSFGWDSHDCNGHDPVSILKILKKKKTKKPLCLVAKTIKGYPISFMKNIPMWHYRSPNKSEYNLAINEIKKEIKKL